tara:strand:- start:142 stop:447 length:306 start_codon:yes stop_codon:yes gene_type:complete
MGDFNQDAFQRLMMMPGGAAGFGMSGAGRDQSFQEYMNKKMQEDAQRRAIEMQERSIEDMMFRNSREFAERQAAKATNRIGEMMDKRRAFPSMGFIPGSMY